MSTGQELPVAVPAPRGRPLATLTHDEVDGLVRQTEPILLMMIMVPGGILGFIASVVLAGVLPLMLLLKLGFPPLVAAAAMVVGAACGLPLFALGVGVLDSLRRRVIIGRARRLLTELAVREEDMPAMVDALLGPGGFRDVKERARAVVAAADGDAATDDKPPQRSARGERAR
jgi:hypothetical protein